MTDRLEAAGEEPVPGDAGSGEAGSRAAGSGEAGSGAAGSGEAGSGAAQAGAHAGAHAGSPARGGATRDVLVVLVSYLALGLVCGVLWWALVDPATYVKVDDGGSMGEVDLGKQFNGDAWYAVIGALAGLGSGVLLTWWRSRDFVLTTVLLLVGASLAAAVMSGTGHLLGPGDPDAALAAARAGAEVPMQLQVTAKAGYLVWPIAALIGSLLVLWTPPRDHRD